MRNGAYVTPGTQLLFLVPFDVWVIANFKEAQTGRVRIGQPATFRADALGNARFHGHVQNLAPAAGSEFAVLKPDNATGNFVKVAQRIAVRISIDRDQPLAKRLRPGMSVVVSINDARSARRMKPPLPIFALSIALVGCAGGPRSKLPKLSRCSRLQAGAQMPALLRPSTRNGGRDSAIPSSRAGSTRHSPTTPISRSPWHEYAKRAPMCSSPDRSYIPRWKLSSAAAARQR